MKLVPMVILAACLTAAAASPARIPAKPNILFILTDDQAVDTIAALGEAIPGGVTVQTPNLDRLARSGTVFRNAANMGAWNGAVCVASRSMLNTGRFLWPAEAAEKAKYQGEIQDGRFWSQRMRAAGYETYMAGKWHVEAPVAKLFDHLGTVRQGMPGSRASAYQRPREGEPDAWLPWDESLGGYWKGGRHWSEVLADETSGFLKNAAKSDKPFFMYIAFNAPHDPRQAPKSFVEQYPADQIGLPPNFKPLHPLHEAMGLGPATGQALRDEALAPFPRTEHAIRIHRREYYALVTHLDAQIGRILDTLRDQGLAEKTVVILTSDHGLAVGRHGLMGKQSMYQHSMRVPFLMAGPGIPAGRVIDSRIYLQDAMATSLDLAGADAAGVDFKSLRPLLLGESAEPYDAVYGAYMDRRQRSIVQGNHKLILYPMAGVVELFDLLADPLEMNDLSARPDSLPAQKRLFSRLRKLQVETGDSLDLTETFPGLR
jgi:arylsulfatase A-like enzyme